MRVAIKQQPQLLKIIPPNQGSLVIKGDAIAWNNPWHFHPEIELLYCISGKGTNFIGNAIRQIEEGEVLLIGSNLPHTRQRDREYYSQEGQEEPETVVVQFKPEFLGKEFFLIPEFNGIADLLNRAGRGIKFTGGARQHISAELQRLKSLTGASAIASLLGLLDYMANTSDFVYLNEAFYSSDVHEKNAERINRVYQYTVEHFREPITLGDVAALTGHSPAAFCRYFKIRTRKSYIQYLTDLRIAYACELLREGNLDVGQVCINSGFNNFSNFYKQFRKLMYTTPNDYRKQSLKKVQPSKPE